MPGFRRLTVTILAGFALSAAPACAAPRYTGLYCFGDSLTDVGNIYTLSHRTQPVSPPYSSGRFSNGPVWVQYMAASLGLPVPLPNLNGGTDYAFGGAETGTTIIHTAAATDLPNQIQQFVTDTKGVAPAGALYVVASGANDLLDTTSATLTAPQLAQLAKPSAINVSNQVSRLASMGARHILVMNVPDLAHVPQIKIYAPIYQQAGTAIAQQFNTQLASSLSPVAASSGATINIVDIFTLFDTVIANGAANGFIDTVNPCWTGNYQSASSGTLCATTTAAQDQFLFWDDLHVTEHGHQIVAAQAMTILP